MPKRSPFLIGIVTLAIALGTASGLAGRVQEESPAAETRPMQALSAAEMDVVREIESARIRVIEQVIGSVVAVYGHNRQGGGSGVIIDPSGIALTNHHVVRGAGMSGVGGLADGNLYEWDLIGSDPGGDVAIIRLRGKAAFPYSPLGDSDTVRVGDWALAMGNPFLLAHDQVPTVTLGIVSGVERFQEGEGSNQLVYGNCIQVDSSINPGNSGGPLFNMNGEVIGINGRGSFRDRGRVNVGLGYAISANQIRNFIPDLLATKLTEHGTLDAGFSERGGKVVCATINLDSPAAQAGLELGDELVEFEGRSITYVNQFKNLICMLPEDWPATLKVRKPDGTLHEITVRLFGLPYNFETPEDENPDEPQPESPEKDDDAGGDEDNVETPPPADVAAEALARYMVSEPGIVYDHATATDFANQMLAGWRRNVTASPESDVARGRVWRFEDELRDAGNAVKGTQTIWIDGRGRFRIERKADVNPDGATEWDAIGWQAGFDGESYWKARGDEPVVDLSLVDVKTDPVLLQCVGMSAAFSERPLHQFGAAMLHGSGKASGRLATRLELLDDGGDWLYCWLDFDSDHVTAGGMPIKLAGDRDCHRTPGVRFSDWEVVSGVRFPKRRESVSGLKETVMWAARCVEARQLEADEAAAISWSKPER